MSDFLDLTSLIHSKSNGKEESACLSIGVVSTGYITAQQKCIMMTYKELSETNCNYRVAIVSCYLYEGFFKDFVLRSSGLEQVRTYSNNLDFIDWNFYLNQNHYNGLIEMMKKYDIVLWDLPEIELIKKWEEKFSPYFSQIDQLSILSVNTKKSNEENFYREAKDYFCQHGFPFDEHQAAKIKKTNVGNNLVGAIRRFFDSSL